MTRPEKCLHKLMCMDKNNYVTKRYSEGFKLKILSELSSGKYSKNELAKRYGLNITTINRWVVGYKRFDLMNKRVVIQNPGEASQLQSLRKELEQLRKLLVRKELELLASESYLEVVARHHGYKDVEELKKNLNAKR